MVEAPQSGNQVEPVELEDSKDEVDHVNNRRPKPGRSFVWDHLVRIKKVVDIVDHRLCDLPTKPANSFG